MYLAISRIDFADLDAKLDQAVKDHNKEIISYSKTSDVSGVITTKDVTIDYNYDPTYERLSFNVGAKHSLAAKIAPAQIIEQHIIQVVHTLEPVAHPDFVEAAPVTTVTGEQLKPSGEDQNAAGTTNTTENKNGFNIKPTIKEDQNEPNLPQT